jgi:hypothetical protein
VISPKALDFAALNARITASAGPSYSAKLIRALGKSLAKNAEVHAADDLVELEADESESGKVHALVLEFDKI